jgi:hypothetical protein
MIDEEFSLSDKIVRIAAMMEEGENCDLNAIASVMEEYKEIYLSNKTRKIFVCIFTILYLCY